jgi:hypothetical protein
LKDPVRAGPGIILAFACREARIDSIAVEIRTKFFPNTSVERYRYASLLGRSESWPIQGAAAALSRKDWGIPREAVDTW